MRVDVVVVGAGHAGCEAAAAAARLGARTVLISLREDDAGRLSCNPAIGGLAKGALVRELDALGGLMARVADAATVQLRRLNTRKGLAVQGSRAQVDVDAYPAVMARTLRGIPGLTRLAGEVVALHWAGARVDGVVLADDTVVRARAVILTPGTFLAGRLHRGEQEDEGGRLGGAAARRLAEDLRAAGLELRRLKTGTVPRVHRDTVDWDRARLQEDVDPRGRLSFAAVAREVEPLDCHVTATHARVHDLIRANLHLSPLYSGRIEARGPRYCPSVEDKVVRFPDQAAHTLHLEREGHQTPAVYVAGLSTSLPEGVQQEIIAAIPGLEQAKILRFGYAVSYATVDPRALSATLEHRDIPGLFLAGQINGTSGYEEAAVQGFVAGVNAAREEPFVLRRDQAYVGVLVDDLVTRGTGDEPYRMFSSRAEHRLLLREDNADTRLMTLGRELGLVEEATWGAFWARREAVARAKGALSASLSPSAAVTTALEAMGEPALRRPASAEELLRRPGMTWDRLRQLAPTLPELPEDVASAVEVDVKYAGYIARAERRAERTRQLAAIALPEPSAWSGLPSLSHEVRERVTARPPATLGALAAMPGITPAAVDAVAAWLIASRKPQAG